MHLNHNKKFVNIKTKNRTISLPVLPVNMQVKLYGTRHRMNQAAHAQMQGKYKMNEFEKLEMISSTSLEDKNIKDIVFDPKQRKYLIDSLNIVTTR